MKIGSLEVLYTLVQVVGSLIYLSKLSLIFLCLFHFAKYLTYASLLIFLQEYSYYMRASGKSATFTIMQQWPQSQED